MLEARITVGEPTSVHRRRACLSRTHTNDLHRHLVGYGLLCGEKKNNKQFQAITHPFILSKG